MCQAPGAGVDVEGLRTHARATYAAYGSLLSDLRLRGGDERRALDSVPIIPSHLRLEVWSRVLLGDGVKGVGAAERGGRGEKGPQSARGIEDYAVGKAEGE